jgi:iron(III) transport system substrate-binding protein
MRTVVRSKVIVVTTILVGLLATACGNGTGDEETTTTAAAASTTTSSSGTTTTGGDNATTTTVDQAAAEEQALYEAAKEEDSMVWYCSTSAIVCQNVNDAFVAKYPGVQAEVVRLVSSQISARFAAEIEADSPTADFIYTADYAFLLDALDKGWTQPLDQAGIPSLIDYPAEWYSEDLGSPVAAKGYSIGYNTDLVTEQDIPTSFEDLLDPKWKDQIISADPSASMGILSGYDLLADHFGEDLLTQLVQDQHMEFISGGMAPTTERLGAGEAAIEFILGANIAYAAIENGAPINYTYPDVTAGNPYAAALNNQPTNPNTAKLFASYFFSQEGENILYENDPGANSRWRTPEFTVLGPNIEFFTDPNAPQHTLQLLDLG